MPIYAVIDTNILVSSLITHDENSPTISVSMSVLEGKIVPLYSTYLLNEYRNVLNRPKFKFQPDTVDKLILTILTFGLKIEPSISDVILPDPKDLPIYEIALDTRDKHSYLVTGNIKHFPSVPFIVTPKQMVEILSKNRP